MQADATALRVRRAKLEGDVLALIQAFTEETGFLVENIDVVVADIRTIEDVARNAWRHVYANVRVEVGL